MLTMEHWSQAVAFHGHECPGLAIGFKACEGAIAELGLDETAIPAIDEEIVCVTENDACGVDAVQSLLGCTYGKANLIPRLRGKMAFSFFIRGTEHAVRLCLDEKPTSMSRDEYQRYLLETPYNQVFSVGKPPYDLPEKARLFNSQKCSKCGELTAEYALRLQEGKLVCADCYNAYQREGF